MGSRSPRHHGRALSRRPLSQPRILWLDRRAVLGSARRVALWRDGGRHDLRDRQQGARSFGRLDLRFDGDDLRHGLRADLFRLGRLDRGLLVPRARSGCWSHQWVSGHHPRGPRLHRHADDAVHRPRRDPRSHGRQEHRIRNQGGRVTTGSSASARSTRSASTIRSSYSWSSRRSGPSLSPIRPMAGRPMRPAATSRLPATPASTPALFACAPTCCPRYAR